MAIIADPRDDVAAALVACLDACGIRAFAARSLPTSSSNGSPGPATAAVFLAGMQQQLDDDAALDVCRHAFVTARDFAPYASEQGGSFVTVQDTGGDFGLAGCERAVLGGLAGLAKTADLEWPLASVKAIDLQRGDRSADQVAQAIADELLRGGPELEVGLRADGRRSTLVSRLGPVVGGELRTMPVVVCSGGARGVTAATLIALAERYEGAPKIALLGRTALEADPDDCVGIEGEANLKRTLMLAAKARGEAVKPADIGAQVRGIVARREIRATVSALRAAGSEASYFATDVSDPGSVRRVLNEVRNQWGPISAIIHGAGVVADKTIVDKTDEQLERVLSPKVAGLRALLDATKDDPIDTLVLFSSVAARTGNVGQCDYAMANEILNKMAAREQRRRPGCLVKSLNWGPWEAGMVTPALKSYFEAHGVPLIPLETGAAMLLAELASSDPCIEIVLGGPPMRASLAGEIATHTALIRVNATTDPQLIDHAIDGTVVLPVVQVLEWFTRAAEALHPTKVVTACQRIRVLRGVQLTRFHDSHDALLLACESVRREASNDVVVQLSLSDPIDPRKRHYSAELTLADAFPPAPITPLVDHPATPCPTTIYGDALFHGPQFQVIRGVDSLDDSGIAGTLDTTTSMGWPGRWQTDPAALDGGLQLAVLWAQHRLGGRGLPAAIGSYQRFEIAPSGPLQCSLLGRVDGASHAVSDITFRCADGRIVATLRDVETYQRS